MTDFLTSLQDSALVANVISFVGLGLIGVVLRAITRAIGELGIQREDIDKTMTIYERFNLVEEIVYRNSVLYKNAVVNSSLDSAAKVKALEDFAAIEAAHQEYLAGMAANKEVMENLATKATAFVEQIAADIQTNAPSILDALKAELNQEEME